VATSWSGQLFVIPRSDGKFDVYTMLPTGVVDASSVRVYDSTGPYPPTGFPGTLTVDDIDAWMAKQQQTGFSFTPGSP
jgi:hypothetical protein